MRGVTLDFSRPGKPTDNAFIESLNGKFRAECLNANWLDESRAQVTSASAISHGGSTDSISIPVGLDKTVPATDTNNYQNQINNMIETPYITS